MNIINQDKTKIIINTQPRSGSRFLVSELIRSLKIKDNHIYATSAIELFEKQYSKYKQINILRDPKDSIISWCAQTRFFTMSPKNTIFSNIEIKDHKSFHLDRNNVLHCINLFENFYECLIDNHKKMFFINFNELIQKTDLVINKIVEEYKLEPRDEKINNFFVFDSFSTGFLKTSKNIEQYDLVKKDIEQYEDKVKKLQEIYIYLTSHAVI